MCNRRIRWAVLPLLAVLCPLGTSVFAQGLISKLPADGTWSRFRVTNQLHVSFLRDLRDFPDEWKSLLTTVPDFACTESELIISSVGVEEIKGERFRWIELFWGTDSEKEADGETQNKLLRIQVSEKVLSDGGDLLVNARVVMVQGGFSESDDGVIKNESRRKYELQMFRQFFPKYTLSAEDTAYVRGAEKSEPAQAQSGRSHRFRFNYQGKGHGGEHGSMIHHANYTVILDPTAPFGVKHLWETDGVLIEDSGPYEPDNKFCDGPGIIARGNSQVKLIESGQNAVSRWKLIAEPSDEPKSR